MVQAAFEPVEDSQGNEVDLIHQLRKTYDYQASLEVVAPDWQGQGVGSELLSELETRARMAGFAAVSVVGDMTYYGGRGYVMAEDFAIHNSLPVPMGSHLIKPLTAGALAHVGGMLEYPAPFLG
nr:GNAT family N-acetyltransferase [Levilactobacillus brevis]